MLALSSIGNVSINNRRTSFKAVNAYKLKKELSKTGVISEKTMIKMFLDKDQVTLRNLELLSDNGFFNNFLKRLTKISKNILKKIDVDVQIDPNEYFSVLPKKIDIYTPPECIFLNSVNVNLTKKEGVVSRIFQKLNGTIRERRHTLKVKLVDDLSKNVW